MLSFSHPTTTTTTTTATIPSTSHHFLRHHHHNHHHRNFTISSTNNIITARTSGGSRNDKYKLPFTPPPQAPPGELFQPFHPPPTSTPPPKYRSLNVIEKLAILRDRLGLWYEYAPLVASLSRDGFTPPSIEDATGISGVEQNLLLVASQVRDSLVSLPSNFPSDFLAFFDAGGGAELLYELRFLNAKQRAAAAERLVSHRLDRRAAYELARAVKDFSRRRGDYGWEAFSGDSPADCLAYTYFRLSREAIVDAERMAALEKALEAADTEMARNRVMQEMEKAKKKEEGMEEEKDAIVPVPVVRLRYGEIAEATTVVLLPVVKEKDGVNGMALAPRRSKVEGDIGIVEVDKGWARWAVVPGWGLVAEAADEAVAIEVADGRVLPWGRGVMDEEKVLVIADRRKKEVVEEGVYVVDREGRLVVERGRRLVEEGVVESAAAVVIVVRPPKDEDDQLPDEEDWV